MAKKFLVGTAAVAEAVTLCRPQVICAYPITPQTGIAHELARKIADGELEAEFANAESEHSAASVVLGAAAAGCRTFTSTSSQGLILMSEVLFNIAGMRLPVVLVNVNRALSAPLNIWCDHQDSISIRDSGVIQLYAENNQEAADLIFLAYKVAEDHRVLLPAMVCLDGFTLSHAWEAVDFPEEEEVRAFLPPYRPLYKLDPENPLTMGMYCEPDKYMEARFMVQKAIEGAIAIIQEAAHQFERVFGRICCGLMEEYYSREAEIVLVGMGAMVSVLKEVADELRGEGKKIGVLKLITYRPFPAQQLYQALKEAKDVIMIERAFSPGGFAPLSSEIKALFYGQPHQPRISSFIAGLGGRDVTKDMVKEAIDIAQKEMVSDYFLGLRKELELEGVA